MSQLRSFRWDKPWLGLACACTGLTAVLLALLSTTGLQQGAPAARMGVLLLLAAAALFGVVVLTVEKLPPVQVAVCLLPLGLALLIRALMLDHMTYDYLDFLSKWAAFFRANGGLAAIKLPVGNYNVPYLYFLALISYLDIPDLYLIKLFSIFFDVALAWGGLRLVRALTPEDSLAPAAAFALLLLLPTVVLNGSYWGQCDSIYAALLLHGFASALEHRPASSVLLAAVAFSFKLQTVFLLPLWAVLWFMGKVKLRHLLLFPVGYVVTILPALLLGKPLTDILSVYLGQMGEYSGYLTLNAPSVYALIPYGVEVDTDLFSLLGILAAGLLTVGVLVWALCLRKRLNPQTAMAAAAVFAIGIPLFLPHMHDRYFFLADAVVLCWACISPTKTPMTVAVQIASLGGYHAYLVLRYAFPMSWGAVLLLLSLAAALFLLSRSLSPKPRPTPPEPTKWPD